MRRLPFSCVLAALLLLAANGRAATATEDKVFNTPMPHTQYGKPATLTVEYVRMQTDVTASKASAAFARHPRMILAECIADRQKRGMPVNPPKVYPSYDLPTHRDLYVSANRTITYEHAYGYKVRMEDCSMTEQAIHKATLNSLVGSCNFDLTARTAEGNCDMQAHRNAPPLPKKVVDANASALQKRLAEMEADPRRVASAAQVRKLMGAVPQASGQKKTILGIECEVVRDAAGRSVCTSQSGLTLEVAAPGLVEAKAIDAKTAAKVNEAVFAPLGDSPARDLDLRVQ